MDSVRSASKITNIWATQFRREDLSLLGSEALVFFLSMSTLWSNISHMPQQLPCADDVLDFTAQHSAADSEHYLKKLRDYISEFKDSLHGFLTLATEGENQLAKLAQGGESPTFPNADALLVHSQWASFDIASLLWLVSLDRSMQLIKTSQTHYAEALSRALATNDAAADSWQELRKSTEESLRQLE